LVRANCREKKKLLTMKPIAINSPKINTAAENSAFLPFVPPLFLPVATPPAELARLLLRSQKDVDVPALDDREVGS
jgi:hypothetical protein